MNESQKLLFDSLTQLQQRVATNVLSGMSQRQAYYVAEGSASNNEAADAIVSRMLSDAKVKSFMDSMKLQAVSDAVMSRQEALERLSSFARTDLKDLVEFGSYALGEDEDGKPIVQAAWKIRDSALQDPQKMAAISELTAGKDGIKIKTHSPLTAIAQLAKMQGWESASKHEITGKDGQPIETKSTVSIDESTLSSILDRL